MQAPQEKSARWPGNDLIAAYCNVNSKTYTLSYGSFSMLWSASKADTFHGVVTADQHRISRHHLVAALALGHQVHCCAPSHTNILITDIQQRAQRHCNAPACCVYWCMQSLGDHTDSDQACCTSILPFAYSLPVISCSSRRHR